MQRDDLLERERSLRERAEQAASRTTHLQLITSALAEAITPDGVMSLIIDQGVTALGAFGGAIGLVTADGTSIEIKRSRGYSAELVELNQNQPLSGETALAMSARLGEAIWIETPEEMEVWFPRGMPIAQGSGNQAEAVIPLVVRDRTLGALLLSFATARRFTDEDRAFITAVAQQCAQAIERAHLLDAERRARDQAEQAVARVSALQELTSSLANTTTQQEVAAVVLEQAVPLFGANAGCMGTYDPERDTLGLIGALGYSDEFVAARQSYQRTEDTLGGLAVTRQQPVFLESTVDADSTLRSVVERFIQSGYLAAAAVPLLFEQTVLGFLVFSYSHRQSFLPEERALLAAFAGQCSHALVRIGLYESEQRARASAEEALKQRDDFLSAAAHELKTPITSLHGFAQLLTRRLERGDVPGSFELRNALGVISRQSNRLNTLVNQMLDVSRLESGRLQLQMRDVDLAEIVREVVATAGFRANERPILVRGPEQVNVRADPDRLEQVLTNLVDNALKFGPLGSSVEIDLSVEARNAVVRVRDHGPGIAPDRMSQLFQPFGHTLPGDRLSGLGLGLYISHEIVTRHGGTLTAESPSDGGALLILRLPLEPVTTTPAL